MIHRFVDHERLSIGVAAHFASEVRDSFSAALSGGHSPVRMYELLPTRLEIDWNKVQLYMGDERYVPLDDPRSNELMIRKTLITHVNIPAENVHSLVDSAGWHESAKLYDALLHKAFENRDHTFDFALQGMGDDGHTASIFPGTAAFERALESPGLRPDDQWVIATEGTTEAPQRLSCTLDCLAASRQVHFIVSGADKAERLKQVIGGDRRFPAAVLASKAKEVHWWVDEAAARLL